MYKIKSETERVVRKEVSRFARAEISLKFPPTVERFIIKSETGEREVFLEEKHFTLGKGGIPKEFRRPSSGLR